MVTSQLPERVACYRHADHLTGVHCTRCGRPICGDCTAPAPVGHYCPTCVREDGGAVGAHRWPRRSAATSPPRLTPVVAILVALNTVVFVLTSWHRAWESDYAQIPAAVAHGQAYRLLTAAFVHKNVAHLFFNMVALVVVGPAVEAALGRRRFLALYLVAAVAGSACTFVLGPASIAGVGASGAIFGIFGAWFSLARAQRSDTAVIVVLIAILLGYSFSNPGIDWRAHVGGLVAGAVMGALFAWAVRRPARLRVPYEVAGTAGVLAALALAVVVRSAQI